MQDTVVLHPGFGVGHLVPMVELAKHFLQRGLAVTVVVVQPPAKSTDVSAAVARAAAANPSINFHVLPLPAPDAVPGAAEHQQEQKPPRDPFALLRRANAPLRDYLHSALPSVRALVFDMFCIDALDVAAELGVPAYFFYPSSASSLAVCLHLPHLQAKVDASLVEIGDAPLCLPGIPPFKPTDLPKGALDRDNDVYMKFLYVYERIPESRGILINTFDWLEARVVGALRDGACVPGRRTPPIYCVGPLVSGGGEIIKKHECLAWLDEQPENSVVLLCFGSMGSFPEKQLQEIATGLEMCGQRFLWVVRSPSRDAPSYLADALPEPDLGELMPEGFLERTKGRGLVVTSWVPQADVVRHRATGAFVMHCGWNSTMEGMTAGLPLLCWPPLYAEQGLSKVFIVEEGRFGVEMAGYDREVVTAEEVESKVRWVMNSEGGRALREQAMLAKERALEALRPGGTSNNALLEFLRDLDAAASR